jgi:hypothetical protein
MSRALLLLLTIGLTIGFTRVASSPGALAGVARALPGAGVSSLSTSEVSETFMSIFSSSTGAGRMGARWLEADGLGRGRGGMLGMCIEDVAESLLIYNLIHCAQLIERTHLIHEYMAAICHFRSFLMFRSMVYLFFTTP